MNGRVILVNVNRTIRMTEQQVCRKLKTTVYNCSEVSTMRKRLIREFSTQRAR